MENNQANQSLNTSNGGQTTFTQATFNAWLNDFFTTKFNSLSYSNQRLPKRMEKLVLDLSVAPAQPIKIPVPFKSCLVSRVFSTAATSTDKAGSVSIMFDYDNLMNQTNAVQLFVNDSFVMDTSVSQAFLTWSAQADTSITLYFFVDIDYRAGTTKTQIVGNVSVVSASTLATKQVISSTLQKYQTNGTSAAYVIPNGFYADIFYSYSSSSAVGSVAYIKINTVSVHGSEYGITSMNGSGVIRCYAADSLVMTAGSGSSISYQVVLYAI